MIRKNKVGNSAIYYQNYALLPTHCFGYSGGLSDQSYAALGLLSYCLSLGLLAGVSPVFVSVCWITSNAWDIHVSLFKVQTITLTFSFKEFLWTSLNLKSVNLLEAETIF